MIPFSISKPAAARQTCLNIVILSVVALGTLACASARTGEAKQMGFATPEQAVAAMVDAAGNQDTDRLLSIFGPEGKLLVFSGDDVQDRTDREGFVETYREKSRLEKSGPGKAVLLVGKDEWPFPIPVVEKEALWYFDTQAGIEEMLARRIGQNELKTIETMMAYTEAQGEYIARDQNGDGILEYAQKIASQKGKRDGLYWEAQEGQEESPFGPLVAAAAEEGYAEPYGSGGSPTPYFGYFYKIVKKQGDHATGGAYDYVVNGRMLFGYALLAYPAEYGSSGIMSFMVNQDGIVYEKDFGQDTGKKVERLDVYDPDPSWKRVEAN